MSDNHEQNTDAGAKTGTSGSENSGTGSTKGVVIGNGQNGSTKTDDGTKVSSEWLGGLSDENKALAEQRGWKSAEDVFKSYTNLEKQFSGRDTNNKNTQTNDGNNGNGQATQYRAGDYVFKAPDNAKDINYSNELADGFRSFAAENGLTPELAVKAHDWFVGTMTKSATSNLSAYQESMMSAITETERSLTKEWGSQNTEGFKRNVQLAERAADQLGIMDDLVKIGVFHSDGKNTHVVNANIFKALAKIGAVNYAEDSLFGQRADEGNPFDPKDARYNTMSQSDLIKNDPEKAELLIRALPKEHQSMWTYWLQGRAQKK